MLLLLRLPSKVGGRLRRRRVERRRHWHGWRHRRRRAKPEAAAAATAEPQGRSSSCSVGAHVRQRRAAQTAETILRLLRLLRLFEKQRAEQVLWWGLLLLLRFETLPLLLLRVQAERPQLALERFVHRRRQEGFVLVWCV
jgi:hypothetical protein